MTMNADHRQLIQAIDELKKEIQRNRPMSEDMDLILEFLGREYQQDTEKWGASLGLGLEFWVK